MKKTFERLFKEDKGQALVLFAVALIVFLGIAAIVVDYGYLATKRRHLQNVADAASLAGAWELPNETEVSSKVNEYVTNNDPQLSPKLITTTSKDVKVDVEHEYDTFFAGIWGNDSATISATATAEKIPWAGEALPFINIEHNYEDYEDEGDLGIWGPVGSGLFGSLEHDEIAIINGSNKDMVYFELKYEDGLTIGSGVQANIKSSVEDVHNQGRNPQYIFSLKSSVIESEVVTVTNKNNGKTETKAIDKLSQNDIISLKDLILLEVNFNDYEFKGGKDFSVNLGYTGKAYDLSVGETPDDYVSVVGRVRLKE